MPRDIKQKEKQDHSIKKLDKNTQFTSRIKRTMIDQYQRTWRDKSNKEEKENSNATNYATTKLMRVGDKGARETTFAITGVSKTAYNKAKMKLAEQRLKKKEENEKKQDENKNTSLIKNSENFNTEVLKGKSTNGDIAKKYYQVNSQRYIKNTSSEVNIDNRKEKAIKDFQKKTLIKERQTFKDIKEHSYKDNGIKQISNPVKIKTRENSGIHNVYDNSKSQMQSKNANKLMKKSSLQKTKENTHKLKEKGKQVGKAVVNGGKKVAKGVNGIGVLLGAGGGFILLLMIIIIMIAGVFKSMFGIFFTNDTAKSVDNISVGYALTKLEEQVDDEIEEIKQRESYDKVVVDKNTIWWKDIVAIYAVIATNRDGIDVANMDDRAFNKLKEIFDEVVDVNYEKSTYYVIHVHTVNGEQVREREARTRLDITVNCKTFDDMVGMYSFSDAERNQALLLLSQEYDEMWEKIFEDF